MLEAKKITRDYDTVKVLKGIDVTILEKEIVSIVGASGAGKTTLLQILGTLDRPTSGAVLFNGEPVNKLSEADLARFRNENIGFIFQFHQLLPEFTALENACLPGYIGKRPEQEVQAKAKELLSYLGLGHRMHHKPSQMSGGEQQRVAVARSLVNNPSVVFADEPSGNLDSQNADELHQLFFKLREEMGQTFVIVTHNDDFAAMADRTIHMKDGHISA
ncbi:MAG: ABC transporter ATP-binding protein [Bacteroidota bacterium]